LEESVGADNVRELMMHTENIVPIWVVNLVQENNRSHLEINVISQFRPETDF